MRKIRVKLIIVLAIIMVGILAACNDERPVFTVTFDINEGVGNVDSQEVKEGSRVKEPTNPPTKSNFYFLGWSLSTASPYEPFDFNTRITEDITLFAFWTDIDIESLRNAFTNTMSNVVAIEDENIYDGNGSYNKYIVDNKLFVSGYESWFHNGSNHSRTYIDGTYYHLDAFVDLEMSIYEKFERFFVPLEKSTFANKTNIVSNLDNFYKIVLNNEVTAFDNIYTIKYQGSIFEFTKVNGYITQIVLNGHSAVKFHTHMLPENFSIDIPVLPANNQWTQLYTVTAILPDDIASENFYGVSKIDNFTVGFPNLKNIYYFNSGRTNMFGEIIEKADIYLDQAFTQNAVGTTIAKDTTVYIKTTKFTGLAEQIINAHDIIENALKATLEFTFTGKGDIRFTGFNDIVYTTKLTRTTIDVYYTEPDGTQVHAHKTQDKTGITKRTKDGITEEIEIYPDAPPLNIFIRDILWGVRYYHDEITKNGNIYTLPTNINGEKVNLSITIVNEKITKVAAPGYQIFFL